MLALLASLLFAPLQDPAPAEPAEPAAPVADSPAVARVPQVKGLLGIAEAEARRTEQMLRERVVEALRKYDLARETSPTKGREYLDFIVAHGPDAYPMLLELMRLVGNGSMDAAFAGPIARALAAIFERTKDVAILKGLAEIARQGPGALRSGVLQGLTSLDHPMVIEIVLPMLNEQDPALRAQVVAVLGQQKSSSEQVAVLLRPLLKQEGAPRAETLAALQELGDATAVEPAQEFLGKSADPVLLAASIRYLGQLGGRASLPMFRQLLTNGPKDLPDTLHKMAVDAVQQIGLRDGDAKKPAEDLLVDVFKHHPSFGVRDLAKWQLGPFRNEEALKSLESDLQERIRQNERSGRSNADNYIDLAEVRLQFEEWARCLDALKKAENEDERGLRVQSIEPLRAAAYCGNGKLKEAAKVIEGLTPVERVEVLRKYPILERLQKDPKYRDLFVLQR